MDLLKMHSDEVRFVIQLNWDRARSSLTFHVTLLTLVGVLMRDQLDPVLATCLLFFTGLSAFVCARMLTVSHGYYRAARDARRHIEDLLHVPVKHGTTEGMRGVSRSPVGRWWNRVQNIIIFLHWTLAGIAVAAGIIHLRALRH
jgi:hypothetical protein